MHWVVARLTFWFNRYFVGYGQYRYARNQRYARSEPRWRPASAPPLDPARRSGTYVVRHRTRGAA
jgi:hypothetical protein